MNSKSMFFAALIAAVCAVSGVAQEGTPQREGVPYKVTAPNATVISGGVVNGKAKNLVLPEYPQAAKAVKASGAVNVQVTIDENGDIISASATAGHPLLRAAAVQAARASTFVPTQLNGQPVKVTGVIVYNFTADQSATPEAAEKRAVDEMYLLAGTMLTIYANADPHPSLGSMLSNAETMLPARFAAEKRRLVNLPDSDKAKRAQVAEVAAIINGKLSGDEAWKFGIGQSIGEISVEARNFKYKPDYQVDRDSLRRNLLNIKTSLSAPPADMSKTTVNLLQQFAVHADKTNLDNTETLAKLLQTFEQLMQSFMTASGSGK